MKLLTAAGGPSSRSARGAASPEVSAATRRRPRSEANALGPSADRASSLVPAAQGMVEEGASLEPVASHRPFGGSQRPGGLLLRQSGEEPQLHQPAQPLVPRRQRGQGLIQIENLEF